MSPLPSATAALSRRARRLAAAASAPTVESTPVEPNVEIFEPVEGLEPVEPVEQTAPVESLAALFATEEAVEPAPAEPVAELFTSAQPAPAASAFTASAAQADDVDVFAAASQAFGFTAIDDAEVSAAAAHPAVPTAVDVVTEGATPEGEHLAPRRSRVMRRVVATGASFGVMGVAGLIAVSMTLPVSAVAAFQGPGAAASASIVAAGDEVAEPKIADDEIQAYVASSDVEDEAIVRSDSFTSVSLSQVAAEEGIKFSESLYTNDSEAAIQWPFKVGVAMSSPYGPRWGRLHAGIDLVPGAGAPIQAIADGVVRKATESGGAYGVTVYIDHVIDGKVVTSHYAHMQYGSLQVKTGDKVKVGDIVGKVGNTGRSYGAHLHFEIIINGSTVDPLPWMRKNAGRYSY